MSIEQSTIILDEYCSDDGLEMNKNRDDLCFPKENVGKTFLKSWMIDGQAGVISLKFISFGEDYGNGDFNTYKIKVPYGGSLSGALQNAVSVVEEEIK
jgi:hypothetical protein